MSKFLPPAPALKDADSFNKWMHLFINAAIPKSDNWTPVITFATPGDLSIAYQYQIGDYQISNNSVSLIAMIQTSTFTHTTASGNLRITGLPQDARTFPSGMTWSGVLSFMGITKANYTNFAPVITASAPTVLQVLASGSGQSLSTVTAADMPTGGTVALRFQITYRFK